jgi:hypothetical protein
VHLVRVHLKVDSADDFCAVFGGDMQVFDVEQSQVRNSLSVGRIWPETGRL